MSEESATQFRRFNLPDTAIVLGAGWLTAGMMLIWDSFVMEVGYPGIGGLLILGIVSFLWGSYHAE